MISFVIQNVFCRKQILSLCSALLLSVSVMGFVVLSCPMKARYVALQENQWLGYKANAGEMQRYRE